VLSFLVENSGWSDELTDLHEESTSGDHPIDLASRALAIDQLTRFVSHRRAPTVLEVGCSSGYFLNDARRALPNALLIGADYVKGPLEKLARTLPDVPLLQLDLTTCPLPEHSVDGVVALNVLEHIADDLAAAREMHRILKPGGVAVVELPAGPWLYDVYDKALMHHRRYTRATAADLFTRAGFRVERATHLGFFVFPAFAAIKLRNKRYLNLSEAEQRAIVAANIRSSGASGLMRTLMAAETAIGRRVRYPFGIRVALTAVKA
jgi:SAM-dependent methyltransferase